MFPRAVVTLPEMEVAVAGVGVVVMAEADTGLGRS